MTGRSPIQEAPCGGAGRHRSHQGAGPARPRSGRGSKPHPAATTPRSRRGDVERTPRPGQRHQGDAGRVVAGSGHAPESARSTASVTSGWSGTRAKRRLGRSCPTASAIPTPATPDDPRDLPGDFGHRVVIEVRFADTDAMGHVNNAVYLTYCEMARIRYWTDVTGDPVAAGQEGAESLILAEARITYRAPVFHGERGDGRVAGDPHRAEQLHARASADGRGTRRDRPPGRGQRIDPRALRLRERAAGRARRRVRRGHRDVRRPAPAGSPGRLKRAPRAPV